MVGGAAVTAGVDLLLGTNLEGLSWKSIVHKSMYMLWGYYIAKFAFIDWRKTPEA